MLSVFCWLNSLCGRFMRSDKSHWTTDSTVPWPPCPLLSTACVVYWCCVFSVNWTLLCGRSMRSDKSHSTTDSTVPWPRTASSPWERSRKATPSLSLTERCGRSRRFRFGTLCSSARGMHLFCIKWSSYSWISSYLLVAISSHKQY